MIILSVNFGHDASLALFENGRLLSFEELERGSRIKQQLGIKVDHIEQFLDATTIDFTAIDMVSICGTQGWALAHDDAIAIKPGWSDRHAEFSEFDNQWQDNKTEYCHYIYSFYQEKSIKPLNLTQVSPAPVRMRFDIPYVSGPNFHQQDVVETFDQIVSAGINEKKNIKASQLTPCSFYLNDRVKPAFYVNHHACHAYYGYFYSAASESFVCTHDGAMPWFAFHSGGIYYASKYDGVFPLMSHNLALGYLYDVVGDLVGPLEPGKLMGLASYGEPQFAMPGVLTEYLNLIEEPPGTWEHYVEVTRKLVAFGERIKCLASDRQLLKKHCIERFPFQLDDRDVAIQAAANIQYLVEQCFTLIIGNFASTIPDLDKKINCLDLAGGFSLNCPSNNLMQQKCPDIKINPLPGAGDTGISIGAAVAVLDFLDLPIRREIDAEGVMAAFPPGVSRKSSDTVVSDGITKITLNALSIEQFIAEQLLLGKVLCIHRGRSEVGPRALGHRSIIAHATSDEIRDRINLAKGRESWRPLAPICRQQDFNDYFDGDYKMGRFMMFTCRVISQAIPAVTHVDGTARVQCIDETDGWLYPALTQIKQSGQPAVIINTSFNCAGEPIVETIEDAVKSFVRLQFDYLVTETGIYELSSKFKH